MAVTGWPCVWAEPKLTAPGAGRGLCTGLQDGEGGPEATCGSGSKGPGIPELVPGTSLWSFPGWLDGF